MKYLSCSSFNPDAYRAGYETGKYLAPCAPEVILLFLSVNYAEEYSELVEGLRDGMGGQNPIIFGCTGDGVYETARVQHHGLSALAINSEGSMKWSIASAAGVKTDSHAAARTCAAEALAALGRTPTFALVFADGVEADGSSLVEGFRSVLPIPFFGGLAGDDRKFEQSFVMVNDQAFEGVAAILLGAGAMPVWMNAASGWTQIGAAGVVESSRGNVVERISGQPAYHFMREQLGKQLGETDVGIVPLAVSPKGTEDKYPALRSVFHFNPVTGSATMVGSIGQGSTVKVCTGTHDEVLAGVDTVLAPMDCAGFMPKAVLVISCAGRKWVLGNRGEQEVEKVLSRLEREVPLIGFPSFGEISPFYMTDGSYSPTCFHNVTFCLCLLG